MGVRPRRRLGAPLKRDLVVGMVREMIADGSLKPGSRVPSAAELARKTGYTTGTCASGLRVLLAGGTITRGVSPTARLWVPRPGEAGDADALRVSLSRALAARRRAAGMTQPELAVKLDVSVTTVGHAETGRLWQARDFWRRADALLDGFGDLLRMFDDFRASRNAATAAEPGDTPPPGEPAPAGPVLPSSVTITPAGVQVTWPDGTGTLVTPPGCQVRPDEWQPGG